MATQRDRFRAFNDEDGAMSLDDLLMQIQQPQIDIEAIARQQAEAQRQAEIASEVARQAQFAEQARQAQIRQEEIRVQNAARLAAEQEAAMQVQARAQSEAERQTVQAPITTQEVINQITAQPTQEDKTANINNLIAQIKAQGTTDKWTGGYGADDATKDMARILSSIGITDINQFGPLTKEVQEYVGTEYEGGPPVYETRTVQTYGNKETGQEVPNTYTERQTGNAFGGTYEGKGNTGYRVDFTPDGKPVFYTTGASSSDIGQYMPMIQLALMATGAGGLLGNALLGTGASQVAAGALGGALLGGGTAALTGQDVLKGALLGGAGGALSGYLNPATGEILSTPIDGSIPVSTQNIANLTGSPSGLGIDYSLANPNAANALGGLKVGGAANLAGMGGAQGFTFNVGAPVTSIANAVNAIATMNGSVNPANLANMGGGQGLTYQTPTGLVTQGGTLNVGGLTGNNSVISQGGINTATNIGSDITKRVAAIDTGVNKINLPATPPAPPPEATAAKTGLTASDVIRAASVAATIASINSATGGGDGGFPIVPIPSDWTSPIKPTGTTLTSFTPLAPVDFGSRELLRGTQWEKFLDPNYGKVPAMPSNVTIDDLTRILGGSTTSAPSQNLSINDVIAGIQNQYGQTTNSTMGQKPA
jgi:hypothetical protein